MMETTDDCTYFMRMMNTHMNIQANIRAEKSEMKAKEDFGLFMPSLTSAVCHHPPFADLFWKYTKREKYKNCSMHTRVHPTRVYYTFLYIYIVRIDKKHSSVDSL